MALVQETREDFRQHMKYRCLQPQRIEFGQNWEAPIRMSINRSEAALPTSVTSRDWLVWASIAFCLLSMTVGVILLDPVLQGTLIDEAALHRRLRDFSVLLVTESAIMLALTLMWVHSVICGRWRSIGESRISEGSSGLSAGWSAVRWLLVAIYGAGTIGSLMIGAIGLLPFMFCLGMATLLTVTSSPGFVLGALASLACIAGTIWGIAELLSIAAHAR